MKCQIKWVDEHGKLTPDENEAVGMAVHHEHETEVMGIKIECEGMEFPICAEHKAVMDREHRAGDPWWCAVWSFREFTEQDYAPPYGGQAVVEGED